MEGAEPDGPAEEQLERADVPERPLAEHVISGANWSVLSQLATQGTRLLVGVIMARILVPSEFGLAGMAAVFGGLATVFSDLSLGAALVQRPVITERDRSTIFWTTAAVGVATAGICAAASPLIADFYGQPRVGPLFAVLGITFAFSGIGVAQSALLTRELQYRTLQIRAICAALAGAVVAVTIASLHYGPWAIIAQNVAAAAVATLLVWHVSPWRPSLVYSLESLRELGGFGARLFASRLLAYANLNMDNLLVGRFLGTTALGIYALAYNAMFTPVLRFATPLQQVLTPALARLQADPERFSAAWLRAKRVFAAVLAPAFLGILVVAPDLVPVVFGGRWRPATPVLELLCVAGVAHSLVTLNWSALQALGKGGTLLRLNLFVSFSTISAFVIGLRWGLVGVAASYAVVKWLLVLPDTWVTARALGTGTGLALLAGASTLPIATGIATFGFGLRLLLADAGVPPAVRLALVLSSAAATYPLAVRLATPAFYKEIRSLARRPRWKD